MESIEDESVSFAGTTCAIVTVLRALLDAQPDQEAVWERLRAEYSRAATQYDANPALAGEHRSLEEVFDMLDLHMREDASPSSAAHDIHRSGRPAASAAASPADGVDDASMYS